MTATSHIISTTPRRGRPLVECALSLRVRDLRGPFGWFGSHSLKTAEGVTIRCRVEVGGPTAAWLHIEHWPAGAAWPASSYTVTLIARPQPFGGWRWRFLCPDGSGPCSTLFLPAGASRFASRQAHGLVFKSQHLRAPARAAVRAQRIRLELGGSADVDAAFPVRPKGVWSTTYERLRAATSTSRKQSTRER